MHFRIQIKKKTTSCIFGMVLFVVFERLLETFGFPHSIIFILDIANLYLLLNMIYGHRIQRMFSADIVKIHFGVILIGCFVAISNGIGLQLIIWALRNLLRF